MWHVQAPPFWPPFSFKGLLPQLLSLLRLFSGFFFLSSFYPLYLFSALLAASTDYLDGYLARLWRVESRLGIILDPIADKFWMGMALLSFFFSGALSFGWVLVLLGREWALLLAYLKRHYEGRSLTLGKTFYTGKVFTTLQFVVVFWLLLFGSPPAFLFYILFFLSIAAFFELMLFL